MPANRQFSGSCHLSKVYTPHRPPTSADFLCFAEIGHHFGVVDIDETLQQLQRGCGPWMEAWSRSLATHGKHAGEANARVQTRMESI